MSENSNIDTGRFKSVQCFANQKDLHIEDKISKNQIKKIKKEKKKKLSINFNLLH